MTNKDLPVVPVPRRARVILFLNRQIEWWDDTVMDWSERSRLLDRMSHRRANQVEDFLLAPEWNVLRRLCGLLRAHSPGDDHCGRPEHRSCIFCGTRMPNAPITKRYDWLGYWRG